MFLLVSHFLGVWWTHRILGFFKERKLNPKSNLNQPDACWEKRGCYQALAKCQQMCFPSHTDHPLKTEPDRAGRVGRRITPAMSLLVLPVCIYYSWVCCCIWFVVLFSFQCSSLCFSSPLWNSWNTFSDFYLCSCVLCICSTWLPPFGHTAVCMGWHCLCFPWNMTGHHPKTTGDTGLLELSTESMNWDSAT